MYTKVVIPRKLNRLLVKSLIFYCKVKAFARDNFFEHPVDLEAHNTRLNLAELIVTRTVIESFKKAINWLEEVNKVQDKTRCSCLYVTQEECEKHKPGNFEESRAVFSK